MLGILNRWTNSIFALAFSFDSRSVGLFRWLLGLSLIVDTFNKLLQAQAFYTDDGVMPRLHWVREYMSPYKVSLLLANGELWFVSLFFLLAILVLAAFTIGYRSRWTAFLAYVLIGSIQSRNHVILSSADDLMRMGLFWFIFLADAGAFSVQRAPSASRQIRGIGVAALSLQLLYIYFFTAIFKLHPVYTAEKSAVYYALNVDFFTKPLGIELRQLLDATRMLTSATMVLEFVGPVAALIPFMPVRWATALAFQFFHLGLFSTLALGMFPWIAIFYWFLFYPEKAWSFAPLKRLEQHLDRLTGFVRTFFEIRAFAGVEPAPLGWQRWQLPAVTTAFLVLVTAFNINSLGLKSLPKLPDVFYRLAFTTNVNQVWDMFAPYPARNDGWFVLEGTFENGAVVDLQTMAPVTNKKPELVSDRYPTSHWRKFMLNLWDQGNDRIMVPFSQYLCRRYRGMTEPFESSLVSVRITFMKETTPPLGMAFQPVEAILLKSFTCD